MPDDPTRRAAPRQGAPAASTRTIDTTTDRRPGAPPDAHDEQAGRFARRIDCSPSEEPKGEGQGRHR